MQQDRCKCIPSEGPKNEVSLWVTAEQQLQRGLPIPLSCILHNSLFVKSQRSAHTPEDREGGHKNIYLRGCDNRARTNKLKQPDNCSCQSVCVCSLYMHLQGGSLPRCHLPRRKTLHQCQNGLHSLDGILLCVQSALQCSRLVAQRHNYVFFMLQTSGGLQKAVIS